MANFPKMVLTNKGVTLQAKVQGGAQLTFTKMAIGDGQLGGTPISGLNNLISLKANLALTGGKIVSSQTYQAEAFFDNTSISVGFWWREWGVFATDPDIGEILYCYCNAGDAGDYIAPSTDTRIEKYLYASMAIGNASNVTVNISSSDVYVLATRKINNHALAVDIVLTKADVGLGTVDNTADAAKNVLSATKLTTARTINGVSFDGTANVTVADSTKEPIISTKNTAFNKSYETTASNIKINGTQSVGTADTVARGDHIHPVDTSRAASSHTHAENDITNLATDLAAKLNVSAKATQAEAEAGTNDIKYMTPIKTKEAIVALSDSVVGDIKTAGADLSANANYLSCDGSIKLNTAYPALATILGTKYGIPVGDMVSRSNTISVGMQVKYINGLFIAVGSGGYTGVYTSPDGVTWTAVGGGTIYASGNPDISYGGGYYLIATNGGSDGNIMYSTNMASWSSYTLTSFSARCCCYGNGLFVAGSNNGIKTATPAALTTWTSRSTAIGPTRLYYINNLFIAIGGTSICTSTDGITWTARTSGTSSAVVGVCYNGSKFVAIDAGGGIIFSTNGTTWVKSAYVSPYALTVNCTDISYSNGLYIATGTTGNLYVSFDGINWVTKATSVSVSLNAICINSGIVVVTGASNTLMSSNTLTDRFYLPKDNTNTMWIRAVE